MATIKAYTDIEQSRKLAEILSADSADMIYHSVENEYGTDAFVATSKVITNGFKNDDFYIYDIPCWSLASLIGIIRKRTGYTIYGVCDAYMSCELGDFKKIETKVHDNEVDACVEMILKLHELNLL